MTPSPIDPIDPIDPDLMWQSEGEAYGFTLPPPAPYMLRLPIIRHIRGTIKWARIQKRREKLHFQRSAYTSFDEWCLYAIMRGWL